MRKTINEGDLAGLLALVFLTTVGDVAIAPLLPQLRDGLDLSGLQAAVALASTPFAGVVLSLPLALVADRLGARRLIAIAGAVLVISMLGQALAADFATFVAARLLFGVVFCIVWTAGPVVILRSARPSSAMGGAISASGAGLLVGPALAGVTTELAGPGVALGVIAALAAPLAVALVVRRTPDPAPVGAHAGLRETMSAAGRQREVLGAILGIGLLGLAAGITNLAVPLSLSANGLTAGAIGIVMSAAAVVWVVAAALAGRLGDRRGGTRLVGIGAAVLGAVWLLPVGNLSTATVGGFLLLSAACRAPLNTFIYVMARGGAERARISAAVVTGLLNVVYSIAAVAGPLAAGSLGRAADARWSFALVATVGLLIGAALLIDNRRRGTLGRVPAVASC